MRGAFGKYATSSVGGSRIVQLTKGVNQEDIENVSRPARRGRTRAGMEFLRNLFGEIQASDPRDHRNPEFHKASHPGLDQIDLISVGRPEIDFDGLP